MFLVSYIWSYNLKANHNKDYSVVKTFKAAFPGRFLYDVVNAIFFNDYNRRAEIQKIPALRQILKCHIKLRYLGSFRVLFSVQPGIEQPARLYTLDKTPDLYV